MKFRKTFIRLFTMFIPFKKMRKKTREKLDYFFEFLQYSDKYVYGKKLNQLAKSCCELDKSKYVIISLGTNCYQRLFTTFFNIKNRKAQGELSMPFDSSVHNFNSIVEITKKAI